jgi:predicted GIY-YIG superfamily endonuclease
MNKLQKGISGKEYLLQECYFDGAWNDVGAVYIYVNEFDLPIYIGQTNNIKKRMEEEKNTVRVKSTGLGAKKILALVENVENNRLSIEKDLIRNNKNNPLLLNEQRYEK